MTNERYEPTLYTRLTFRLDEKKTRTVWALELPTRGRVRMFRIYAKNGEKLNEMVACAAVDVVREAPARMSLKYGEMEVAK